MASLPGAWHYRVSAGTGWSGVSILWLGEIESLICNFCHSVAACTIEQIRPWDTLACCWVKQASKQQTNLCLWSPKEAKWLPQHHQSKYMSPLIGSNLERERERVCVCVCVCVCVYELCNWFKVMLKLITEMFDSKQNQSRKWNQPGSVLVPFSCLDTSCAKWWNVGNRNINVRNWDVRNCDSSCQIG